MSSTQPSDILFHLKQSADDPNTRKAVARDATIVGGLVLVLSGDDTKTVIGALEVLIALAEDVESRPFVRNVIGMEEQLATLASESNALDYVRDLATRLRTLLYSQQSPAVRSAQQPLRDSTRLAMKAEVDPAPAMPMSYAMAAKKNPKGMSFLNVARAKTVILQVKGLCDKHDMEVCRGLLLTVKGVISITFDLQRGRSIVRTKPEVTPQTLANAVAASKSMSADMVVKDENGDEKFIPLGCKPDSDPVGLPPYLSSEEDSSPKVDEKTMARRGGNLDDGRAGGWLGAAANFLSRSFYW